MVIEIIRDRTGRTLKPHAAASIRQQILNKATRPVDNRLGYVARSLATDWKQYLPPVEAPHERSVADAIRAATPRGET